MLDREKEEALLPYCGKHEIGFLAYSPLAMGLLTGKIKPGAKFPEGDMRNTSKRFASEAVIAVNSFLDEIRPLAKQHGLTLAQLVINWTLQQPGISHVLCGARHAAQAHENAAAAAPELGATAYAFISDRLKANALQVPKAFA
jgi:methylglyoxal reductase